MGIFSKGSKGRNQMRTSSVPTLVHWHYIDLVLDEKTGKTTLKTKPETDDLLEVLLTLADGTVETDLFDAGKGRFDYFSFDEVIAWAYFPKPCRPPEKKPKPDPWDMHPDAITCRKYMEGDPETVKELEIFDA